MLSTHAMNGKDKDKGSGGMSAKSLGSNHDGRVIASKNVHCALSFDSVVQLLEIVMDIVSRSVHCQSLP